MPLIQLHLFVLASHADLSLLGVFVIEHCLLQDFIVNLAGMEFGAGANPGLQVIMLDNDLIAIVTVFKEALMVNST